MAKNEKTNSITYINSIQVNNRVRISTAIHFSFNLTKHGNMDSPFAQIAQKLNHMARYLRVATTS